MKIGFITPEYVIGKYSSGGLANYLYRLCNSLASMGHEIHVFLSINDPSLPQLMNGVHVHSAGQKSENFQYSVNRISGFRLENSLRQLSAASQMAQIVNQHNQIIPFDIIQSASYKSLGLFISTFLNIPLIVRASSYRPLWNKYNENKQTIDNWLVERLEIIQFKTARKVFAPSKLLAGILEEEVGLNHVEVIPTPFYNEVQKLDYSWYKENLIEKEYLLFFGSMLARKGVHILAQALPSFFDKYPQAQAVFIGPDKMRLNGLMMIDYIRDICKDWNDNIVYCSKLNHAELYPVIQGANLVVLPSLMDNYPNTLLEAMGLGSAVVGTSGSSMEEIIEDGITGFLVPPGDVNALKSKIIEVWESDDLRKIGIRAKLSLSSQTNDERISKLLSFYQNAIDSSKYTK